MRTSDFHFDLPEELIAQHPTENRSDSRLLHLDSEGSISHRRFPELLDLLHEGDLLVFNDTRVIPARLYGAKETGGRVEILIERVTGDHSCSAHIRASKSPKAGSRIRVDDSDVVLSVTGRSDSLFLLESTDVPIHKILEHHGHVPLPPYITRNDSSQDHDRYQTVYAAVPGAVAAPTAGLHFDDALMSRLSAAGIQTGFVTLHVGAGTFKPVKVDDVSDHVMHQEWLQVTDELVARCDQIREDGGRIIAVGTTSVRALETAAASGKLCPYEGDTDIFIYPGYEFRVVDALLTNFHLPQSTLLMLVSALSSRDKILNAYEQAVEHRYRFFSYGDAMFIER